MHLYLPTHSVLFRQKGVATGHSVLLRQTKIGISETHIIHIDTANLKRSTIMVEDYVKEIVTHIVIHFCGFQFNHKIDLKHFVMAF